MVVLIISRRRRGILLRLREIFVGKLIIADFQYFIREGEY